MPRISPAWVEHKCVLCGAVYETPGPDDRELCDDCEPPATRTGPAYRTFGVFETDGEELVGRPLITTHCRHQAVTYLRLVRTTVGRTRTVGQGLALAVTVLPTVQPLAHRLDGTAELARGRLDAAFGGVLDHSQSKVAALYLSSRICRLTGGLHLRSVEA